MKQEKHTASLGDRLVDIIKLREIMNDLTPKERNVNDPYLIWQVGPNHHNWIGSDGKSLGPYELLHIENWERAEIDYPNWKKHIHAINNADFRYPIWLCDSPDMYEPEKRLEIILDGLHRYTRAVMDGRKRISTVSIKFEEIPEEYYLK